ncbi:MAG TPA: type IV-A pilus assembly ATPase PilB [Thermodesulfovibrionia bacterium]|nr:type IV-A pilus assembly ATPase PilB [Thermodesulfovibrionia bacterium]
MTSNVAKLLVSSNIISKEQLQGAIEKVKKEGGRLENLLVQLGHIAEADLVDFLSMHYGVPSIDLDRAILNPAVSKLVPFDLVKKFIVMPIKKSKATITVAMSDPSNVFAIDSIKFRTNYNVETIIASESSILRAVKKYYVSSKGKDGGNGTDTKAAPVLETLDYTMKDQQHEDEGGQEEDKVLTVNVESFNEIVESALESVDVAEEDKDEGLMASFDANDAPVVRLVNGILINALEVRASDIHIEPYEKTMRVRYRVDGAAREVMRLPVKIKNAMSSRIKIMANLDIAEKRLPQDGRIKLKLGKKREIDYRVSVLPTLFGEKIVLRLLDKTNLQLDMTRLGFDPKPLEDFKNAINSPYGMILVTGPTGSGKTTTLYSALSSLNQPDVNIMTAEDPVEFNFAGINQVQVQEKIGLTFSAALRSFLRQDPDIILVGEIRDIETGEIAVKAALTGHLVLSTLHTNDAPSTIQRMLNMGIEPFLVAASVVVIVAQRLARKLCPNCKEEIRVPYETLINVGFTEEEAKTVRPLKGKGCPQCGGKGAKGRVALYEVMLIKDALKELILRRAPANEIKAKAIELGMQTLRRSGLKKVIEGVTSIEEVLKVSVSDNQ